MVIFRALAALLVMLWAYMAFAPRARSAENEPAGVYFAKDIAHTARFSPVSPNNSRLNVRKGQNVPHEVFGVLSAETTARIGAHWVPTTIKLAKIESNFNPRARNRSSGAAGVLQVLPSSARAMGFSPSRLTELRYGTAAGVEHMRRCIASGVRTHREMAFCHVAGFAGWKRRPTQYAVRYMQLAGR
jgi:hypothetical protein